MELSKSPGKPEHGLAQNKIPISVIAAFMLALFNPTLSLAADPNSVAITLEGCRQESLPSGYDIEANNFLCDVGAGVDGYTTGNLGKKWNELDLVPWRVRLKAGNSAPASQTYTISIVVDHEDSGAPGYDAITAPTLNATLSHASCGLSFSTEMDLSPGFGGTDTSLYRYLTVTQDKNTLCVIDAQARLAVGSHLFSGSSLHFNVGNDDQNPTTQGIGNKDVSIPVNEILPQELNKDMSALQDTDFAWNITKTANPAIVNFANTCDVVNPTQLPVNIRIEWEVLPGQAGTVLVVTNIYATNPAARTITVNVTDVISGDIGAGVEDLDTASSGDVAVPANTTLLLFTHTFDAPAGVTNLSDVATASYIDQLTGIPVPGTTTAEASAAIQPGTNTNTTAIISDTEALSGNAFAFSVTGTSAGSADGSFTGYIPGTETNGPVAWASISQSDAGFVEFNKLVHVSGPVANADGTLSDVANLNTSDGFTASANASVSLSAGALVSLTISKEIQIDLQPGDPAISVSFDVVNSSGDIVAQRTLVFSDSDPSVKSVTINNLDPDLYNVVETDSGPLTPIAGTVQVNLDASNLDNCSATADFVNVPGVDDQPRVQVKKITMPESFEAGWEFALTGPLSANHTSTSTAPPDFEFFQGALGDLRLSEEGDYSINETLQVGWINTARIGDCDFNVNFPADLIDKTYQCTFVNKKLGRIIINKITDPADAGGLDSFGYTSPTLSDFTLQDGGTEDITNVVPGTYTITETDPTPLYDLVSLSCEEGAFNLIDSTGDVSTRTATINVDPGETVECTFTNRKRGMVDLLKLTQGVNDPNQAWNFSLQGPGVNTTAAVPPTLLDFGGVKLMPGELYTLCETGIPAGYQVSWALDGNGNGLVDAGEELSQVAANSAPPLVIYDPAFGGQDENSTLCVDFSVAAGDTAHFILDNVLPPGGDQRTIGYWKNWASCANSKGGQYERATEKGFATLDANLPQTLGTLLFTKDDCADARNILDKRDIKTGRKRAGDAAYNLASQLMAAKLNVSAGAGVCAQSTAAILAADALLTSIGFDGEDRELPKSRDPNYAPANALAETLDAYNNGSLCP